MDFSIFSYEKTTKKNKRKREVMELKTPKNQNKYEIKRKQKVVRGKINLLALSTLVKQKENWI